VVFAFFLFFVLKQVPNGVVADKWGPKLSFEHPITSGPLVWILVALVVVPPIVAAAAYLRLHAKVDDPQQKRRVLLVGWSILLWFLTSLGATAGNVQLADWWQVASRVISLLAAGTIYYAFAGLKPSAPSATAPAGPAPYLAGDPMDPRRRVAPLVAPPST
jgi:MFS family permease